MEKVIAISKKQLVRLVKGRAVVLSREGTKYILSQKEKSSKETRVLAKIAKLQSTLAMVRKEGIFPCDRCSKTFSTRQGRSTHNARAHVKNWSSKKKGVPVNV